jgi:PE-PPE domain
MAGRHRKYPRSSSITARIVAPSSLAAAAVGATSLATALMTGTTTSIAVSVDLLAVVAAANSTSQIFAGTTYYGTDYSNGDYGDVTVVPFYSGPQGIADAIEAASGEEGQLVIVSSGWGAGQTGTALRILMENNPDGLPDPTLVILDNNSNRAGGGFWTTYYPFAPLLLTSAEPSPTELPEGVTVLDVGYQYNVNSDAPVDPTNPFAVGNALMAYIYGYGAQSTTVIPEKDINGDPLVPGMHYVVQDGVVVEQYPAPGTDDNPNTSTIYVTDLSDELPLTKPLRLLPGGDIVADTVDPTLTRWVNAGYNDGLGIEGNEAVPVDPSVPRPMQPGSSLGAFSLGGLQVSVQEGLNAGAETLREDLSNPTNFMTKPLAEAGDLPLVSLVSLPTTTSTNTSLLPSSSGTSELPTTKLPTGSLTNKLPANGANKFEPSLDVLGLTKGNSGSGATSLTGGAKLSQNFTHKLNDAVKKVTSSLQKAKPGDSEH